MVGTKNWKNARKSVQTFNLFSKKTIDLSKN